MPQITRSLLNNLPPKVIAPGVAPNTLHSLVLRDWRPHGFASVRSAGRPGTHLAAPPPDSPQRPFWVSPQSSGAARRPSPGLLVTHRGCRLGSRESQPSLGPHPEAAAQMNPFHGLHASRPALQLWIAWEPELRPRPREAGGPRRPPFTPGACFSSPSATGSNPSSCESRRGRNVT